MQGQTQRQLTIQKQAEKKNPKIQISTILLPPNIEDIKGFAVLKYQAQHYAIFFNDKFLFISAQLAKGGNYQTYSMGKIKKIISIHLNYILIVKETKQIGIFQVRIHPSQKTQLVAIKDFLKAQSHFLRQVKDELYQVQVFFSKNQFCSYQFSKGGQIGFLSYTIDQNCNILKTKDMGLYGTKQFYSQSQGVIIRITDLKTVTKTELNFKTDRQNYVIGSSHHQKYFKLSIDANGLIYIEDVKQGKEMMFPIKIERTQFNIYYNMFMIRSSQKTVIIKIDSIKKISLVAVLEGIPEINAWVSQDVLATYRQSKTKKLPSKKIKIFSIKNSPIAGKINMIQSKVYKRQSQIAEKTKVQEPAWKPSKIITRNKINTPITQDKEIQIKQKQLKQQDSQVCNSHMQRQLKQEEFFSNFSNQKQVNQEQLVKNRQNKTVQTECQQNSKLQLTKNRHQHEQQNKNQPSTEKNTKNETNLVAETRQIYLKQSIQQVEEIKYQTREQFIQQSRKPKPILSEWSMHQKQKQIKQLEKITEGNQQKMRQIQKQIQALLRSKSNTITDLEKAFQQQEMILNKLKNHSQPFQPQNVQQKLVFGEDCRLPPKIDGQIQLQGNLVQEIQNKQLYEESQYIQMVKQFYEEIIDNGAQDSKLLDQIIEQLMLQSFQKGKDEFLRRENQALVQQKIAPKAQRKLNPVKSQTKVKQNQTSSHQTSQLKKMRNQSIIQEETFINQIRRQTKERKMMFDQQFLKAQETSKDLVKSLNLNIQKLQNIRKYEKQNQKVRKQFAKKQIIEQNKIQINKILMQQVITQVQEQSKAIFSLQQGFYQNVTNDLESNTQRHSKMIQSMVGSKKNMIKQFSQMSHKMTGEIDKQYWKTDRLSKRQIYQHFQSSCKQTNQNIDNTIYLINQRNNRFQKKGSDNLRYMNQGLAAISQKLNKIVVLKGLKA